MSELEIIPAGFRQPPVIDAVVSLQMKIAELEAVIEKARDTLVKGDILCEIVTCAMLNQALPVHKRN